MIPKKWALAIRIIESNLPWCCCCWRRLDWNMVARFCRMRLPSEPSPLLLSTPTVRLFMLSRVRSWPRHDRMSQNWKLNWRKIPIATTSWSLTHARQVGRYGCRQFFLWKIIRRHTVRRCCTFLESVLAGGALGPQGYYMWQHVPLVLRVTRWSIPARVDFLLTDDPEIVAQTAIIVGAYEGLSVKHTMIPPLEHFEGKPVKHLNYSTLYSMHSNKITNYKLHIK